MFVNSHNAYFQNTHFLTSVFNLKHLPKEQGKEIAFAGYSNCGKSSVINLITQKRKLATTSKTPGRTKSINYFHIAENNYLVDLPGYGYANVAGTMKKSWGQLLDNYLINRVSLIGVILIMDIRHPLKELDQQMLLFCAHRNIAVHIVLNKSDKLTKNQLNTTLTLIKTKLHGLHIPQNTSIQTFSALKQLGVQEAQEQIIKWI